MYKTRSCRGTVMPNKLLAGSYYSTMSPSCNRPFLSKFEILGPGLTIFPSPFLPLPLSPRERFIANYTTQSQRFLTVIYKFMRASNTS